MRLHSWVMLALLVTSLAVAAVPAAGALLAALAVRRSAGHSKSGIPLRDAAIAAHHDRQQCEAGTFVRRAMEHVTKIAGGRSPDAWTESPETERDEDGAITWWRLRVTVDGVAFDVEQSTRISGEYDAMLVCPWCQSTHCEALGRTQWVRTLAGVGGSLERLRQAHEAKGETP